MTWKESYQRWLDQQDLNIELKEQLEQFQDDPKTLEDCFYKHLEFGTGGMRGELGAGTNRMNIYTIRKASEGFARYISSFGDEAKQRGVVIAYDPRHKSAEFARQAALTLGKHAIQTYIFDALRPTPELSFAVRYLKAFGGIVITASHNPPEYNGYKVYGPDGGQVNLAVANDIIARVNQVENELTVEVASEQELLENGRLKIIGQDMDKVYTEHLKTIVLNPAMVRQMGDELKIVFTPLHGTAYHPVMNGLQAIGFTNIMVVEEQAQPDPNFSTVKSPNPEEHEAFELAIQYARKNDADLLIGTDPDADRLGVVVKNLDGEYVVLTGNQTGALLLHYLLSQKKKNGTLPENGIVLKTIVTSEMGRVIAKDFGLYVEDTLTGFKFIGEKINEYKSTGAYQFQFGYEESYGYLIGDFVRDKDAVQAALLAAEVCAFYKSQGKSMYEGLIQLFEQYGYYLEDLRSLTLKGKEGTEQIKAILSAYREQPPASLGGKRVEVVEDYLQEQRLHISTGETQAISLPRSDVLKYICEDESWVALRPSGTEPKIKFYFGVKGDSFEQSEQRLKQLMDDVMNRVHALEKNSI